MLRKGILLAGVLSLGGCWEETPGKEQRSAAPTGQPVAAVKVAAEDRIRAVSREVDNLRFRAVEAYRQAIPDTYAVCGQATVSGGSVFIPFVSIVKTIGDAKEVEQYVGRTNIEATRVYVEMVSRCFEGGGPVQRAGGGTVSSPAPPLPNGLPILNQVGEPPPALMSEMVPAQVQTANVAAALGTVSGSVLMRQNGNLRASPAGSGVVLRVARTGSMLTIFGTAPGGWYQVGEGGPEGWVHGSLVSVHGGNGQAAGQWGMNQHRPAETGSVASAQ